MYVFKKLWYFLQEKIYQDMSNGKSDPLGNRSAVSMHHSASCTGIVGMKGGVEKLGKIDTQGMNQTCLGFFGWYVWLNATNTTLDYKKVCFVICFVKLVEMNVSFLIEISKMLTVWIEN